MTPEEKEAIRTNEHLAIRDLVARAIFKDAAPFHDDCCNIPDFEKCPCREDAERIADVALKALRESGMS